MGVGSRIVRAAEPGPPLLARRGLHDTDVDRVHRLLVHEGLRSIEVIQAGPSVGKVRLFGKLGDHLIQQTVTLCGHDDFFHIEVEANLAESPPTLEYLLSSFTDFLVRSVQADGCVPAWFADLKPLPSLRWNADGGAHIWVLSELYRATQNAAYLDAAQAVADFATLYQAVWAPHYIITAYPFGGFSSQLGDAEWLDQRSHRFAGILVKLGLLAERQDLLERGVAAARASLTLVNHPRHLANGIYAHPNFPLGLGPENIDHEGFPQMPLRSGASWCEVGGLAAADVLRQWGSVYVDTRNHLAVGIDGIEVRGFHIKGRQVEIELNNLLAGLPDPYGQDYEITLHMIGPEGARRSHVHKMNLQRTQKFTEGLETTNERE